MSTAPPLIHRYTATRPFKVMRAAAALSALGVNPQPNGGGGRTGGELALRGGAGQSFNLGGDLGAVLNNTTQQRRDIVSGVQLGQQIGGNGNQTAARIQQLQRYTGGNPLFKPAFRETYTDTAREERRARQRQQAVQVLAILIPLWSPNLHFTSACSALN